MERQIVVVPLIDAAGLALGEFEVTLGSESQSMAAAAWLAPGRADEIVAAVASRFGGHRIRFLDRPDLADGLLAIGGRIVRHRMVMALDLSRPLSPTTSPPPEQFTFGPMSLDRALEYGTVLCRAYPPDHPDHEPGDGDPEAAAGTIASYLRGEEVGPWIDHASIEVADRDGRFVGAIVISDLESSVLFEGGPWIADVFVDPAAAGHGLGSALVAGAAVRLAAGGRSVLGLAVTIGNPARRIYDRLGFEVRHEMWQIELPLQL